MILLLTTEMQLISVMMIYHSKKRKGDKKMNNRKQALEAARILNGNVDVIKEMHEVSFPMAGFQVIQETKDVKVFEVNECEAVAAHTLEEAKAWYLQEYEMDELDAFYDHKAQEISKDKLVWYDEERTRKVSVGEIVDLHWNGKPFLVYSTEV